MAQKKAKILCVGDLHTKLSILEKVIKMSKDYDRVVFLGDYVDEWGTPAIFSVSLLQRLIEFKKENPKKVILLLGNHDLSEWQAGVFKCSGFNAETHESVYNLFYENEQYFQIAYAYDGILFTHAGLTKGWCIDNGISIDMTAQKYADLLNLMLTERYEQPYKHLFSSLHEAGPGRGGWHSPSPLWADELELRASPVGIRQVVGHTPQRHILIIDNIPHSPKLAFCDTFSLYPDYSPYGNQGLLEINGKKWKEVSLCAD